MLIALIAPPAIHWLWQGRWDESAFVVQLFTLVLPIYLMSMVGGALLESRGEWRLNAWLHLFNGLGTVAAASAGVYVGGIREVTIAAAGFRVTYGLLHGLFVSRMIGIAVPDFLGTVLPPAMVSLLIGAVTWTVAGQFSPTSMTRLMVVSVVFVPLLSLAYLTVFRARIRELGSVFQNARSA